MATFQKQVTYASINEKLKRSGLILRGGFTQEDQTTLLIGLMNPSFGNTLEAPLNITMLFQIQWIDGQNA